MTRAKIILAVFLGWAVAVGLTVVIPSGAASTAQCKKHPERCATTTTTTTTTTVPPTTGPVGIPGTWTLRFQDEFSGTSLDSSRWEPLWFGTSGPVNGSENNCYSTSNVAVGNGVAQITARQQSCVDSRGVSHPYTSGIIASDSRFQFQYGVAEVRLYLPDTATGQVNDWPAWWMVNDAGGSYPEIDIFEAGGGGSGTYHVHMPTGNPGGTVPGNWTGWHTYAVNWQPGFVRWYWDGQQVAEVTNSVPAYPLFLIINMGISSGTCCGGPVVVPNTIQADYVRVWQ